MLFSPTHEQRFALDEVLQYKNIFITGCIGSGKSAWIRYASYVLRKDHNKSVQVCACTNHGSMNVLGRTIHTVAQLGYSIDRTHDDIKRTSLSPQLAQFWRNIDILIIDEINMLHPKYFQDLDFILKLTRDNPNPFGGIQLIVVGDFYGLQPVLKKNSANTSKQFCFQTDVWTNANFKPIVFQQNVRYKNNPQYWEMMKRARVGLLNELDTQQMTSRISHDASVTFSDCELCIKPIRICSRKLDADRYTVEQMQHLNATPHNYYSIDGIKYPPTTPVDKIPKEFQIHNSKLDIRNQWLCDDPVQLSIGMQVVLLIDLDPTNNIIAGSRGVVVRFHEAPLNYPIVRFRTHDVIIRAYMWKHFFDTLNTDIYVWCAQIPLKAAYGISLHKGYHLVYDCASINLNRKHFMPCTGQAYVAMGQVQSLEYVTFEECDTSVFKANQSVINFYAGLGIVPSAKRRRSSIEDDDFDDDDESDGDNGDEEGEEQDELEEDGDSIDGDDSIGGDDSDDGGDGGEEEVDDEEEFDKNIDVLYVKGDGDSH